MPKVFGIEHILFILVFSVISVAGLVLIRKFCKTEKNKNLSVLIVASLLLAAVIFNRISISAVSGKWLDLIPNTFCGFTSFSFAIFALVIKDKNHPIFHFYIYMALIAGALSTIYPDYIGQASSIWYSKTISGLLHHAIAFDLALLILLTGKFMPDLKKWYCMPLGFVSYITFGLFLNQVFGMSNAMNINKPFVADTPFTWYLVGPLVYIVQIGFLLCFNFIKKKRRKQHSQ